ncbi:hypothetical protein TrRE_jg10823 [Triparma retinervis]|uniref:mitogen-activated protein kinase kinase n=1 Tax=Triparma retinervis TaxID=2557542 RepID=A0A9W7FHZ9_9STRA|nr:hypothetical protein TrRE_jg10823 [Triparma retinervis]
MAFRRKRPQLNLDFVTDPESPTLSSGTKNTGRSDTSTPEMRNLTAILPGSRYGTSNSDVMSTEDHLAVSNAHQNYPQNYPQNNTDNDHETQNPSRRTTSGDVISDTTYRSPGLGLSIGNDYVRIHTNSSDVNTGSPRVHDDLSETLQIKSAQPWSTHLHNLSALGRGQCSTVYKAVLLPYPAPPPGTQVRLPPKPRRLYAVKSVQSYDVDKSTQLLREISLLSTLSCRSLVQFEGAFFARNEVSIVLEFMDRGSLESLVRSCAARRRGAGRRRAEDFLLPRPALAGVMYQLLWGLSYLHYYKMSHRDVKPANVLINSAGEVKISDFGIASGRSLSATAGNSLSMSNERTLSQSRDMNTTHVGTSMYMSPERLRGGKYGISGDVWGLGLVFLECSIGVQPFGGMSEVEIVMTIDEWDGRIENIIEGEDGGARGGFLKGKERGWQEIIGLCLLKDPKRRIRSDILVKSPWLKEHCGGDLDTSIVNVRTFLGSELGPQDDENLSESMVGSMVRTGGGVPREYEDMCRSLRGDEGKEEGKGEGKEEGKWGEEYEGMDTSVNELSDMAMTMSMGRSR